MNSTGSIILAREGGREKGRKAGWKGEREGGREGWREGGREGKRERGEEGERDGGMDGRRERGKEGGRDEGRDETRGRKCELRGKKRESKEWWRGEERNKNKEGEWMMESE